eukprot:TRINITY_DN5073_c0_g1_i2.p1 TRINITY_DN5073_c0_g1~~TRINITY_DN5073_c0_g1_i2.p1  ORF type:complete len:382 (+),score=74.99 TRINITY_DN5073_c0_g1_i2:96-1148(+)
MEPSESKPDTPARKNKNKNKNKRKKRNESITVQETKRHFQLKVAMKASSPQNSASSKKLKKIVHQDIIASFHTLLKQKEHATLQNDETKLKQIEIELEKLGGLPMYQQMSLRGEKINKNYNTSKWIFSHLTDYRKNSLDSLTELSDDTMKLWKSKAKWKLLDVGALGFHYKSNWISATAIDLNAQPGSGVIEQDFFEIENSDIAGPYDVICLSLVINFIGDIKKRGEMLMGACRMLPLGGLLFVVLPLPCVQNSRYFSHERFIEISQKLGLKMLHNHDSNKLAHYMFRMDDKDALETHWPQADVAANSSNEEEDAETATANSDATSSRPVLFPKEKIRNGSERNNFCIVL